MQNSSLTYGPQYNAISCLHEFISKDLLMTPLEEKTWHQIIERFSSKKLPTTQLKRRRKRKIYCKTPNGEIKIFSSITPASNSTGVSKINIYSSISRASTTRGGYSFSFLDEVANE